MEIPVKVALTGENSVCGCCGISLGKGLFVSHVRYCNYTGYYCCKICHKDETSTIPARVVINNDKRLYSVSHKSKLHILNNMATPLINVNLVNPRLYEWDVYLNRLRKVRCQMLYLGEFIRTCRTSDQLIALLGNKKYLLDSVNIFCLRDLLDAKTVLQFLYQVKEKYLLHITKTCETCKGKGSYCEICNSKEVIFSFQFKLVIHCPKCKTLLHRTCVAKTKQLLECPKCERIKKVKG